MLKKNIRITIIAGLTKKMSSYLKSLLIIQNIILQNAITIPKQKNIIINFKL